MQLSANFSLYEFLVSQTATRHNIDMTPSEEIKANIQRLVDEIMQPLRDDLGAALLISSGYRPEDLNSLIGGSKTSAHRFGCAADFRSNAESPLDLCERIVRLDLPYDQVIHEFGRWVHVGIRWDGEPPRKEKLTAYKDGTLTLYAHGIRPMSEFVD